MSAAYLGQSGLPGGPAVLETGSPTHSALQLIKAATLPSALRLSASFDMHTGFEHERRLGYLLSGNIPSLG